MANTLIQAFRNLKMRSQIISLDIMILLLVLSIAGIAIYVEIKIFYYISERSLQNTLVISDIKQISLTTHLMKHYIKEKHKISILLADHISSFLHFYSKIQHEVNFTKPIDPCYSFDQYIYQKQSFSLYITCINKSIYNCTYKQKKLKKCVIPFMGIQIYRIHCKRVLIFNNCITVSDCWRILEWNQISFIQILCNLWISLIQILMSYRVVCHKVVLLFKIPRLRLYKWKQRIKINPITTISLRILRTQLQSQYKGLVKSYLKLRYVDHIKKAQEDPSQFYFFTDVYRMIVGDYNYYFSITQSLWLIQITLTIFNKDKQFIGILKMMQTIDDLNMQNTKSNIMLINKYGQVIYKEMENQEFYNNSQVFYIYNETITGFNNSDWEIIEDQAISNIKTEFENESEQYKCIILYNKFYKSSVQSENYLTILIHLRSEKFIKENFTLIIYTNITTKKNLEEQFEAAFLESENWILIAACSILFLGALSISMSTDLKMKYQYERLLLHFLYCICYINIICQPLIEINHKISNHVLSVGNNLNRQIFKILLPQRKASNLYAKLNEQLWNLQDTIQIRQKKKCEQCILIEKMFYHRKDIIVFINKFQLQFKLQSDKNRCQQHLRRYSIRFTRTLQIILIYALIVQNLRIMMLISQILMSIFNNIISIYKMFDLKNFSFFQFLDKKKLK